MFCILIGVVPPPEFWESLQRTLGQEVTSVGSIEVQWRNPSSPTIIHDDGTPTLLLRAITETTPDNVVEAVETALTDVTCELWASCPAPLPLRPSKGYDMNVTANGADEWGASSADKIRSTGVVCQKQVLTSSEVEKLRTACNEAIAGVESAIQLHRPSIVIGQDAFLFREIASRGNERFDLRLSNMDSFVQEYILENVHVKALLEQVFGLEFDYDVSVVYSRPGAPAQGWHADGDHVKGAADAGWAEGGHKARLASAYAVCLFIPLIDLSDDTGFTQFWPESHRHKQLAGFASVAELTQATWDGKCAAGDGIWYDYRLFHRGMPNRSSVTRPVLQVIFKRKWYVERANYGTESIILQNSG